MSASGGAAPPDRLHDRPDERLYGRRSGHRLRARQRRLLEFTLPRLRLTPAHATAPEAAFARHPAALWLEIGFGAGEHARGFLAGHPDAALIACEVFRNGLCSLLGRLVAEGEEATGPLPGMLRLWDEDARRLLPLLPERCLDGVVLLFPDPWPKARHVRRRFVHPDNLGPLARAMMPGGEWRIASDDPVQQAWVAAVLRGDPRFSDSTPLAARPPDWPPTRYEAKALAAGRSPRYWSVRRTCAPVLD
ncbi:MAG: tRNA (guanosine(46)-N7)-methyltransferase TrmB [Acidisphaera sp.]|nr:tRNA (guanosine(46)-N7)-methyltransferase TrmB [Acidisphaera sp.]